MKTFVVISTISWEIIGRIVATNLRQAKVLAGFKYEEPITVVSDDPDLAVDDAA